MYMVRALRRALLKRELAAAADAAEAADVQGLRAEFCLFVLLSGIHDVVAVLF